MDTAKISIERLVVARMETMAFRVIPNDSCGDFVPSYHNKSAMIPAIEAALMIKASISGA
jgi:hypothetical protein